MNLKNIHALNKTMITNVKFSVLMSVYYKEKPEHLEQALASNLVNP